MGFFWEVADCLGGLGVIFDNILEIRGVLNQDFFRRPLEERLDLWALRALRGLGGGGRRNKVHLKQGRYVIMIMIKRGFYY